MSASSNDNPQSGQNRPLPKKESDLFKNVVKFYESKSYKKGLKNADTILKRFPNHGETLCMKGLIVNAMASSAVGGGGGGDKDKKDESVDKKKEAIELVKRGLMMDMRSHVCWHVYGLLHRSSQNYTEAIKAYKQALRIDPENLQILRDMGLLQIQLRDLAGFRDTRLRILTLRPNSKVHWLTYALSVHVNGDAMGAVGVLDSYMGTLDKEESVEFTKNFESSELALYKNMVLSETVVDGDEDGEDSRGLKLGGIKRALEHLDEIQHLVVDMTGWLMARLSYQLQLSQFHAAKKTIMLLLERGSTEDHRVHGAYMCVLLRCDRETCLEVEKMTGTGTLATLRPLTDDERMILLGAYDGNNPESIAAKYPRSAAIKRIRLTLLPQSSSEFKSLIDKYTQRQIVKGVPSLGLDLSSLYLIEDDKKFQRQHSSNTDGGDGGEATSSETMTATQKKMIRYTLATDPVDVKTHPVYRLLVDLVNRYIASLVANNTFPNDDSNTEHPPSTLLWAWYLRSILHEQAAQYSQGLTLIDKCIEHTPTAVDFYELKSRLLEHGGDIQNAANVVDAGRDLDHQDRYINNQTTQTLLRAGREEDAAKIISLFTRHEAPAEQNLYDMQCTWYELELADCWRRKGELGKSLRKYMAVIKHYEDFHEDQFDFHMYCIRKVTLRSYCKLLKFEDELWGLPHYGRAAEEVIRIHLRLVDDPNAGKNKEDEEPDYSKMTPAERKKAKNIARKKQKKKAQAAAAAAAAASRDDDNTTANGNKKKGKPHVIDEDPEGKELLALDHLEEAKKYAAILVRHAPKRMSAWAMQYDVSIRRGKMLLALQALFKMRAIDPDDHRLFSRIVDYSQKLSSRTETDTNSASEEVISSEFPTLMNGQSLSDFVQLAVDGVKANSQTSLPMRVAVARATIDTKVGSNADASALVLNSKLEHVRSVNVESCREALAFMESLGKEYKERMRMMVMAKYSFAKDF